MRIRKLTWQFFLVCFVISTITLWITTWYSARVYNSLYLQSTTRDVSTSAYLLQREVSQYIADTSRYCSINSLCKQIGQTIGMRITVVNPSGKVIGDSEINPDSMENHANRPEILKAISGQKGIQQRFSSTLQENMLYVALPVYTQDSLGGAVRIAVSLNAIRKQEHQFYLRVALASLIIFLLLILTSYILSQRLSEPIRQIKDGAKRFAAGELHLSLPVPKGEELGELADSLNRMASILDERIKTVTRQHNESKAILSSMTEGVIAIDADERIISINPAAARLFNVPDISIKGKWLHEVIRNSTLQRFLTLVLSCDTIVETTFILHSKNGDLHIKASGTILGESKSGPEGAVLGI